MRAERAARQPAFQMRDVIAGQPERACSGDHGAEQIIRARHAGQMAVAGVDERAGLCPASHDDQPAAEIVAPRDALIGIERMNMGGPAQPQDAMNSVLRIRPDRGRAALVDEEAPAGKARRAERARARTPCRHDARVHVGAICEIEDQCGYATLDIQDSFLLRIVLLLRDQTVIQ